MKSNKRFAFITLIGAFLLAGLATPAHAVIRVYKVSISAKATFFSANSFKMSGYLIYDTATPGNSQTVQVRSNKTFTVNTGMLTVIFPSQIFLVPIDKNTDGFNDTESALVGFQSGGATNARSYNGAIPKNGFRIQNTTFLGTARSLKGNGAVTVGANDQYIRTDTFTLDTLSAANPATTDVGRDAVIALLVAKGYQNVQ